VAEEQEAESQAGGGVATAGPASSPGTPTKEEPKTYARVLVVSAHPDDPEFSAGASVAALARRGSEVFYCICTDGSQGGEDPSVPDAELSARRYEEQRRAAATLGVKDVVFLGFRDGHLAPNLELRHAITAEIRRLRPDLVITHSPVRNLAVGIGASHPDHLAVGEATLCAVYPDARNPRAFTDLLALGLEPHKVKEVWVPGYEHPDHFVEVDDELLELKFRSIMCHTSQFEKPGIDFDSENGPRKWITDRMRQAGEKGGYRYAEAFRRIETA
jgi:LmbE family N-acetylglucosaminyl deacetylase